MRTTNDLLKLLLEVQRDIVDERGSQNDKWGWQRHSHGKWLGILMEEVGEVAEAFNSLQLPGSAKETDSQDLYKELIQVAAVAAAFAEQVREEQDENNGERKV